MAQGTLTVSDLLATQRTVVELGEDRVFDSIDRALAIHNQFVQEKFDTLVDVTSDRARRYGGVDQMTMDDVDEVGSANAQKITAGSRVEFPLYKAQVAVQWSRTYFENATGKEFAEQFIAAQDADVRRIERDIKRGLFYSANKTTVDRLVDNNNLAVKALVNADSATLPIAPDGTTFNAATHTHYLYTAGVALALADLNAVINTVIEHADAGKPTVYINSAQETAVRALAGFTAITPIGFEAPYTALRVNETFDQLALNNRKIGYFGNNYAEIWVKPWIPAGYLFAFMNGGPKPLVMRVRRGNESKLTIQADLESHPLRAKNIEREFGIAAWNRVNGAVLYIDTGAVAAYVQPTIA